MLKFASLGSGSSGNATVVSAGGVNVLVDCGFSVKDTCRRLQRLGMTVEQLAAVVVTHEHSDHIRGIPALSRKLKIPVYMTRGTFASRQYGDIPGLRFIEGYRSFCIEHIRVQPVAVPHDAREPAQFIFSVGQVKLGILTDLGSVTEHITDLYDNCNGLLVEANHDRTMLAYGPYPPSLKERVGGPWGHLSNEQTAALLTQINLAHLQHLVVGHISQKNNCVDLARRALATVDLPSERIHYACQEQGFDWIHLQ